MKTDKQLQKELVAEILAYPDVNLAEIAIDVDHGVVTLSGHVDNYTKKAEVEEAAKHVQDIKLIIEDITVDIVQDNSRSDHEITNAAIRALKQNNTFPHHEIYVAVKTAGLRLTAI